MNIKNIFFDMVFFCLPACEININKELSKKKMSVSRKTIFAMTLTFELNKI